MLKCQVSSNAQHWNFPLCCLPLAYLRPLNTIQLEAALETKRDRYPIAPLSEAKGGLTPSLALQNSW
ncbi:hypothetical protein [Scytonema sp. HK-05]|uniref:hypothetical protein n=1 Tax=Scytonema sp. HK-05 TaxID=1137095 RepID=UPI00093639FC|nr:hypothetical protein [Scytonema sp. HK-05]